MPLDQHAKSRLRLSQRELTQQLLVCNGSSTQHARVTGTATLLYCHEEPLADRGIQESKTRVKKNTVKTLKIEAPLKDRPFERH